MKKFRTAGFQPLFRLLVVMVFAGACSAVFGFLWVNAGGSIPLVAQTGYRTTVSIPRVANVVYFSDVMVAGVKVGKVRDIKEQGDSARVEMDLDDDVAPLHEGATVQVRAKSMLEESFLEITDGKGRPLPSGTELPAGSAHPPSQVDDLLRSLDSPTRDSLGRVLRSSGMATKDSHESIARAAAGLGDVGRNGGDAVDALAAQSQDLRQLTASSTTLLAALNSREGQIAQLVEDANTVTSATADGRQDIERSIRALPPLLEAARGSSDDLRELSGALGPVAQNLQAASPDLSAALAELPATSDELRRSIPALDGTLAQAPATLDRAPVLARDVRGLVPNAKTVLADANPMLGYLEPYGQDVAAFFTNFAQTLATGDVNGKAFRVMPPFNEQSYKGIPLNTNFGPLDKFNPLPPPGSANEPGPYVGKYPRVQEEAPPR